MQEGTLDDEPCRRQFALQKRAEAETCGHVWKGRERLPVRIRDADPFEPQIELPGLAIDAEARRGDCDLHSAGGPIHDLLDKGGQPAEIERPLRQTPQAEPAQEDQRRRGCAEPRQNAVGPTTQLPGRRMMPGPLDADRFAACVSIVPFGASALTGDLRPASLPAPAGLTG
jgi:hypothetical protein